MACRKNKAKKGYYLPADRLFGFHIFHFHHGGGIVLAVIAFLYIALAVYIAVGCFSEGKSWLHLLKLYLYVLPSLFAPVLMTWLHQYSLMGGRTLVASDAVLIHILRELNDRCSNGFKINWRQIAHSANKFSEELGESPIVFYNGKHCLHYFLYHVVDALIGDLPVFKESKTAAELHIHLAESAFKKYQARIQRFSKETEKHGFPLELWLEKRRERLGM